MDDTFDWPNVKNLGMYTYLLSAREGRNPDYVAGMISSVTASAGRIAELTRTSGYGRGVSGYWWGSNGAVVRTAMNLVVADRLAPDPAYRDAIVAELDHVLGRNMYDRSQVTGVGNNPPVHPHHRPSAADRVDAPWPGLLVGGRRRDDVAMMQTQEWQDIEGNANVNEIAINWNAPLVYAAAALLDPP
jgi:endoglucanase